MNKMNVYEELPLVANVCNQLLREVDKTPAWSMAHVLMNPRASSLPHQHYNTEELYIITRGTGNLVKRSAGKERALVVKPGDVIRIPQYAHHKLENAGIVSLEHLVLATPPFNPTDVYLIKDWRDPDTAPQPFVQPLVTDCFDGAKIVAYKFPDTASVAFGWVMAETSRHKLPHYHKEITERIFVVEGGGFIELEGILHEIVTGDWLTIKPREIHALRNINEQHMVVVCICTPCFSMDDVYYI